MKAICSFIETQRYSIERLVAKKLSILIPLVSSLKTT